MGWEGCLIWIVVVGRINKRVVRMGDLGIIAGNIDFLLSKEKWMIFSIN